MLASHPTLAKIMDKRLITLLPSIFPSALPDAQLCRALDCAGLATNQGDAMMHCGTVHEIQAHVTCERHESSACLPHVPDTLLRHDATPCNLPSIPIIPSSTQASDLSWSTE